MENASVPFMDHPFHPITIKKLSKNVQSRIRNGHQVRISPKSLGHSIDGEGLPLMVHSNRMNEITKCMSQGKGLQMRMSPEELMENRKITGGAGMFGKKFDKKLKQAGVKKLVYSLGAAAKPFAQEGISTLGTMADFYAPGLGTAAATAANDYMDRPSDYHKAGRETIKSGRQAYKEGRDAYAMDAGMPTGNYKQRGIDMLTEEIRDRTGQNVGTLDRASLGTAMANRASAELNRRLERAQSQGQGLYAGRGLGAGLYGGMAMPMRREYHSIGGRHSMMGAGVPALVSQPFGVNYQFRAFLPPAYQQLHT